MKKIFKKLKKMNNQFYTPKEDRGIFRSKSNPDTFYETVAKAIQGPKKVSLLTETWRAFTDGCFGGLTFMILIVYIFSNTLMAGHLHNSELYVQAFGIAGVYGNIFSFFVWGFNAGFIVTASRYFGLKNYKAMHKYFMKQVVFIFGILSCFFIYCTVIYFLLPYLYPGDDMLLYWTRAYLVLVLPVNFSAFYMDTFRELFIANEFFQAALYVELVSMFLSFFICYFLAFVLEFDFFGLVAGMILTQITCVGLYVGIYRKGRIFREYWANKDAEPINLGDDYSAVDHKAASAPGKAYDRTKVAKSIKENMEEGPIKEKLLQNLLEPINADQKVTEGKKEEAKIDLNSNWGYFKFNIVFSFTMFLDGFWWQMDAVLCSFLFDGSSIAAQTTLTQFLNVITLFGYGYTMTLSSKISQYLVILDVDKAKRIFWIISFQMLLVGCVIAFPFVFMSEYISPIMIDSIDTRIVLERIMKVFGVSIPFMFLSSVSFATNRSINNQNIYFICQIICNYGVHFGSFIFLNYYLDMGVDSLWYAYLASQISITVVGYIMAIFTDWHAEAEKICKQMSSGGNVGGH